MESKVMGQLRSALQPILKDIQVDWSDLNVANQYKDLKNYYPPVFDGDRLIAYTFVRGDELFGKRTARITATTGEQTFKWEVEIDMQQNAVEGSLIHRLAASNFTKALEKDAKTNRDLIVNLGTTWGIVTKYTAYVAIEERDSEIATESMQLVDVNEKLLNAKAEEADLNNNNNNNNNVRLRKKEVIKPIVEHRNAFRSIYSQEEQAQNYSDAMHVNTLSASKVIDTQNYSSDGDEEEDDFLSEKVTESGISLDFQVNDDNDDLGEIQEDPETRSLSRQKRSSKKDSEKSAKAKDMKKEKEEERKPKLKALSRKRSESPPKQTIPSPSPRSSTTTTARPSDSFSFGSKSSPSPVQVPVNTTQSPQQPYGGIGGPFGQPSVGYSQPNAGRQPIGSTTRGQQQPQPYSGGGGGGYGQPGGGYGQPGYGQTGGSRGGSSPSGGYPSPPTQQGFFSQSFNNVQPLQQQQQQQQPQQPQSPQRSMQNQIESLVSRSESLDRIETKECEDEEIKELRKVTEKLRKQASDLERTFSDHSVPSMSCELQSSASSSSSSRRENAISSPSKKKSSSVVNAQPVEVKKHSMMRGLDSFIILQNAEGSFSMTKQFLLETYLRDFQILDNMPTYIEELTIFDKDEKALLWVTAIAIAYLEKNFLDSKIEWELICDKSIKYLNRRLRQFNCHEKIRADAVAFLKDALQI